ncbi:hypothetical protein I2485_00850 [Nesterenkonia sp. E16_7]|uniref:hypothetical protein n=1 Tax=unclassified Nesterenkonia TaxID=2629769 RepID=UPI001A92C62A|nr:MULTISPECIES: hypothetical protein [unclassified Nesterenkonia]MBO0596525.1 hypothetical protein [Nesterenkonia sp. E16_10]MBO0597196.1 hypothetical protein [Nesterenkonia sp. E16_7]
MEHTESAFLSTVQGLSIPSSALMTLIAVLFLGTLVLRGRRQATSLADAAPVALPAPSSAAASFLTATPASTEPTIGPTAHPDTHRGATMSSSTDLPSSASSSQRTDSTRSDSARAAFTRSDSARAASPREGSSARPGSGFHMHWGRTLVALLGVIAALSAVVTGILAPLTAVPAAVPLGAAGVFLLALVALRTMAVLRRRGLRRARVQSAIEEAMNPLQGTDWVNPTEAGLFDALSADGRGAGGPDSLQPTDEDGLPVGLERTFDAEVQASGPVLGEAAEPVGPWQPRAVPRPKYLDLDKAQRIEPEALAVQTPAPRSDVKLTQRRFLDTTPAEEQTPEEQTPAAEEAPAQHPAAVRSQVEAPKQDSMNLDEVLKRRRA